MKQRACVAWVIFTCEGREHLLRRTYASFREKCSFKFKKIILAADGQIAPEIVDFVQPDLVVQSFRRKGYVHNIVAALKQIDAPFFFWLEDDWTFHRTIDAAYFLTQLTEHPRWAEIVFNRKGPLSAGRKKMNLGEALYATSFGFSANPCFCNTGVIKMAFALLEDSIKGDRLGEDGFENFLSKTFAQENIWCVVADPVDHIPVSHEGYLESTPRSWHMTNSLEKKTNQHLLVIPAPPFWRRLFMVVKITGALITLACRQFYNNEAYEICFRVVTSIKGMKKRE